MADLVLPIQADRDAFVHGLQHGPAVNPLDVLFDVAHVRHLLDEVETPPQGRIQECDAPVRGIHRPDEVQVARNAE